MLLVVVRLVTLGAFALALAVAAASWLVRTRRVAPFSPLGRALRRASDLVMRPVEARVVRMGGNPVQAGWWLTLGVAVAGVVLLTILEWAMPALDRMYRAAGAGPAAVALTIVSLVYTVLVAALFARVISSWVGLGRYNRWLRPAYVLTDWIVEPLRKVIPPLGSFDISPLVAWLVLWIARRMVIGVLL
jgi:YggT family protein